MWIGILLAISALLGLYLLGVMVHSLWEKVQLLRHPPEFDLSTMPHYIIDDDGNSILKQPAPKYDAKLAAEYSQRLLARQRKPASRYSSCCSFIDDAFPNGAQGNYTLDLDIDMRM